MTALLLAIVPMSAPLRDWVDLVEINHVYDRNGCPVFTQIIWWDRTAAAEYRVRDWRLMTDANRPERQPSGKWSSRWHDGDEYREVIASAFRESWTQYDPELTDRQVVPQESRRRLSNSLRVVEKHQSTP